MIKQIKSSEIKNYIKENSNVVLLDVRTENEWATLGKPNAEDLNSKTYFVTVSPDLSNWQVPDPNFVENVKKNIIDRWNNTPLDDFNKYLQTIDNITSLNTINEPETYEGGCAFLLDWFREQTSIPE